MIGTFTNLGSAKADDPIYTNNKVIVGTHTRYPKRTEEPKQSEQKTAETEAGQKQNKKDN